MPNITTNPDRYFAAGCGRCNRYDTAECSARRWAAGLAKLRSICLAAGLVETVKWGHACYMQSARNVAILGAFQRDFRLSFFNPSLLQDPQKLLEKAGDSTDHPNTIRFTDAADVDRLERQLLGYLLEAKGHAAAGIKPIKMAKPLDLPDELATALAADAALASAFNALTPGRQRSYVVLLRGAKQAETRIRRIEKARPQILAGKGADER